VVFGTPGACGVEVADQRESVAVSDEVHRSRRWALRADPRSAIRTAVIWDALDALLDERVDVTGGTSLDIIDLGGGTGGFAVPIAQRGHRVTVVEPSPDAIAALQRRVDERGLADRVQAVQGDESALVGIVGEEKADLVLLHGVLEHVEDPAATIAACLAVLRPAGYASLLVAQRLGAVVARVLSGRFTQALDLLNAPDGSLGQHDVMPRRFDEAAIQQLLAPLPGHVVALHGVRIFTDLLPGVLVDGDPEAAEALLTLEREVSDPARHPELVALASHLHVVIRKSAATDEADEPDADHTVSRG
jgi:SAM-dependent methyltransferase